MTRRCAGSARDPGDRASHARKSAHAVAGPAPGGAGRGRASKAPLDVYCPALKSRPESRLQYEKSGPQPRAGPRRGHPSVSRAAGGAEQRGAPSEVARAAAVRLRFLADSVVLEVEDDGVGFGNGERERRAWAWFPCGRRAELVNGRVEFMNARRRRRAGANDGPGGSDRRRRMPDAAITVLLVDDHSLVRRGFRRMLEDDAGIEVVGRGERRQRSGGGGRAPASRRGGDGFRPAQHERRGGHAPHPQGAPRRPPC